MQAELSQPACRRNLVGTGLVQLASSVLTAAAALAWLFAISWQLTLLNLVFLACFGAGMTLAFGRLRPLFRERGRINAEVSSELSGVRGMVLGDIVRAERQGRDVYQRDIEQWFNIRRSSVTATNAGWISSP